MKFVSISFPSCILLLTLLCMKSVIQASWSIKELLEPPQEEIDRRSGERSTTTQATSATIVQHSSDSWFSILFPSSSFPASLNYTNKSQSNLVLDSAKEKKTESGIRASFSPSAIRGKGQRTKSPLLTFPRTDEDSFVYDARRDWHYPVAALSGIVTLVSAALLTWLYMDSYDITIPVEELSETKSSRRNSYTSEYKGFEYNE